MSATINSSPALGRTLIVLPFLRCQQGVTAAVNTLVNSTEYQFITHINNVEGSSLPPVLNPVRSQEDFSYIKVDTKDLFRLKPSEEFYNQIKSCTKSLQDLLFTIHTLLSDYDFDGDLKGIVKDKILKDLEIAEIKSVEDLFFALSGEVAFNDRLKEDLTPKDINIDDFNPGKLSYDIYSTIKQYRRSLIPTFSHIRLNDSHAGF